MDKDNIFSIISTIFSTFLGFYIANRNAKFSSRFKTAEYRLDNLYAPIIREVEFSKTNNNTPQILIDNIYKIIEDNYVYSPSKLVNLIIKIKEKSTNNSKDILSSSEFKDLLKFVTIEYCHLQNIYKKDVSYTNILSIIEDIILLILRILLTIMFGSLVFEFFNIIFKFVNYSIVSYFGFPFIIIEIILIGILTVLRYNLLQNRQAKPK